ncbi:hypothetical protein PGB90_004731 [Kerria lacca]
MGCPAIKIVTQKQPPGTTAVILIKRGNIIGNFLAQMIIQGAFRKEENSFRATRLRRSKYKTDFGTTDTISINRKFSFYRKRSCNWSE